MIKPGEIQKKANAAGVRDTQIEKDYMLTWVLQGIANNGVLSKHLVFKGGTVLKKAYFEDYRFSEDLDFTLLDDTIENEAIFQAFGEVFDYIREEANIPLEIIKDHEHQSGSVNFYIGYTGPLGGLGTNKRLKVDITRGEILEFEALERRIFSEYSDSDEFVLLCYSLEEILIEKMCALMGRTQPRDYYDLWYLLEIEGMDIKYFWPEFERKAANKNHNPEELASKLEKKLNVFKGRWKGTLSDQIKDLPDFDQITRELNKHFRKI